MALSLGILKVLIVALADKEAGEELFAAINGSLPLSERTLTILIVAMANESAAIEFALAIENGLPISQEVLRILIVALASSQAGTEIANQLIDNAAEEPVGPFEQYKVITMLGTQFTQVMDGMSFEENSPGTDVTSVMPENEVWGDFNGALVRVHNANESEHVGTWTAYLYDKNNILVDSISGPLAEGDILIKLTIGDGPAQVNEDNSETMISWQISEFKFATGLLKVVLSGSIADDGGGAKGIEFLQSFQSANPYALLAYIRGDGTATVSVPFTVTLVPPSPYDADDFLQDCLACADAPSVQDCFAEVELNADTVHSGYANSCTVSSGSSGDWACACNSQATSCASDCEISGAMTSSQFRTLCEECVLLYDIEIASGGDSTSATAVMNACFVDAQSSASSHTSGTESCSASPSGIVGNNWKCGCTSSGCTHPGDDCDSA